MAAKILIVEDDASHLQLLTYVLKNGGYEVIRAYGGEDALKRARTQSIDLIVTDLAMPKMSGVDMITCLKDDDATRDIPIIAVSAHISLGQSAAHVGCDAFVGKPFDNKSLLREVERVLEKHGAARS